MLCIHNGLTLVHCYNWAGFELVFVIDWAGKKIIIWQHWTAAFSNMHCHNEMEKLVRWVA